MSSVLINEFRRSVSLEEKLAICRQWQCSGMSKSSFCKKHELKMSTFSGWCYKHLPKERGNRLCEVAIIKSPKEDISESSKIEIEVSFPNQLQARVRLQEHQVLSLIKGLSHAATTSW